MADTWIDQQDPRQVQRAIMTLKSTKRGREMIENYALGDERFALWLSVADRGCFRRVGVGIFDISDWRWRDAYDEGVSPRDAFIEALENDDLYGPMFST